MAKKLPSHITLTPGGRYRVRYKKAVNSPIPFDKTFDTLEEAIDAKEKHKARITLRLYPKNRKGDIGFSDFCDLVLEWYQTKPKKPRHNTLKGYRSKINQLKIIFGNEKLRDITALRIELALSEESKRQNRGHGKAANKITDHTLCHEFTMLRIIFNKAKAWGFIDENPLDQVEKPTFEVKEIEVPEFDDFEKIEEKIFKASIEDRIKFLLGLYSGMREEEVCAVHKDDFDRENGTVVICRAIVQDDVTREFVEDRTKSSYSNREIPLPPKFFDELDKYYKYYLKPYVEKLKMKSNGKYKELPNIFLNKDGHFFRPRTLYGRWKKFTKKEDLDMDFHNLRHYYISNQMNNNPGLTEKDVQKLAGHANIQTTFRYVHASKKRMFKHATDIFTKFNRDTLYKNGKDVLTIPISHIATIILGNPKLSQTDEVQITLSEICNKEVDFFNISDVMKESREFLIQRYPALENIEKYRYSNFEPAEMVDKISQQFGKEVKINNIIELEPRL